MLGCVDVAHRRENMAYSHRVSWRVLQCSIFLPNNVPNPSLSVPLRNTPVPFIHTQKLISHIFKLKLNNSRGGNMDYTRFVQERRSIVPVLRSGRDAFVGDGHVRKAMVN